VTVPELPSRPQLIERRGRRWFRLAFASVSFAFFAVILVDHYIPGFFGAGRAPVLEFPEPPPPPPIPETLPDPDVKMPRTRKTQEMGRVEDSVTLISEKQSARQRTSAPKEHSWKNTLRRNPRFKGVLHRRRRSWEKKTALHEAMEGGGYRADKIIGAEPHSAWGYRDGKILEKQPSLHPRNSPGGDNIFPELRREDLTPEQERYWKRWFAQAERRRRQRILITKLGLGAAFAASFFVLILLLSGVIQALWKIGHSDLKDPRKFKKI